eukprot:CAMPEP_0115755842 /NCGR_PEP_ID=MMETSP0272-20121206/97600_1 /TAXON_ID=71861 /ORGANISM="Scrippsiella trochoidea, Strain CCMP3099" /LENGTH=206 /DNA_ID=CAMNT_0003201305 /DNA_START=58 /DNA_END=678 /DNA_ORIENTATION=-
MIADSMEQIEKVEHSALYPVLRTITQVVTWQGKMLVSMSMSALALRTEYVYQQDLSEQDQSEQEQSGNEFEESLAWLAISFMRNIDNLIFFGITFAIFGLNARWFVPVKSVFKVLGRVGIQRRAPELWKFYREDKQMQQALENLAPKTGEWPDFADLARIPDSLKGSMASLPDLQKLQQQLGKIKGLAQFKLPDLTHPSNQPAPPS